MGVVTSYAEPDVPTLLGGFREARPGVEIVLSEASTDVLVAGLRDGTLDLALVSLPAADIDGLETRVVTEEALVAAVGPEHPLAGRDAIGLRALRDLALVGLPRGTGLRSLLDDACAAAGFAPRIALEAGDPGVLARLAARGLGAAIVPASLAAGFAGELRAVPIVRPELRGALALAWRAGGPASPAGRALVRAALAAGCKLRHPSPVPTGAMRTLSPSRRPRPRRARPPGVRVRCPTPGRCPPRSARRPRRRRCPRRRRSRRTRVAWRSRWPTPGDERGIAPHTVASIFADGTFSDPVRLTGANLPMGPGQRGRADYGRTRIIGAGTQFTRVVLAGGRRVWPDLPGAGRRSTRRAGSARRTCTPGGSAMAVNAKGAAAVRVPGLPRRGLHEACSSTSRCARAGTSCLPLDAARGCDRAASPGRGRDQRPL